jgi:SnoaL-like domain
VSTAYRGDEEQLRDVAARYARGVDTRDAALFASAFHPNGVLELYRAASPDEPAARIEGHEALGRVVENVARYDKTFHFLGQQSFEINEDRATGEVYCMAHHLTIAGDEASNWVMYIRYHDEYIKVGSRWAIANRKVHTDWTSVLPAQAPRRRK